MMNEKNEEYVVDTSVTAKLFVNEAHSDKARLLYQQASQQKISLIAPELTWYELNSVLTKAQVPFFDIQRHLFVFQELVHNEVIKMVPVSLDLLNQAAFLASMDTQGKGYISSFDATFHALALLKKAIFITADKTHYNKTKDLIGSVVQLEDFSD
jgi:predicted nucleic acid-binding protein